MRKSALILIAAATCACSTLADKHYAAGKAAAAAKDYRTAVAEYTKVIQLGEQDVREAEPAKRVFELHSLGAHLIIRGRAYSWLEQWDDYANDLDTAVKTLSEGCRDPYDPGIAKSCCKMAADAAEEVAQVRRKHPGGNSAAAPASASTTPAKSSSGAAASGGDCQALYDAAHAGQNSQVTALLDAGTPVDCPIGGPKKNMPALMVAAFNGKTSTVKLLLDRGADPSFKTPEGMSALDYAGIGNHPDTESLLRKRMK